MTLARTTAYKCESCAGIAAAREEEPLYECSDCGNYFLHSDSADGDSHRCPNDNKFARKVADSACSLCQAGEADEIEVLKCDVCGEYVEDLEITECPRCKEAEMTKKENERLAALPVEQRGGQKVFATRDQAVEAFMRFLASVKSEHITLTPAPDYDFKPEEKGGVRWQEIPRPEVSFHFRVMIPLLNDRYVESIDAFSLTEEFRHDADQAAKEHLKGEISWNNIGQVGWIYLTGDDKDKKGASR